MVSKYSVCLKKDNPAVIFKKKNSCQKLENNLLAFPLVFTLFCFLFVYLFSLFFLFLF